MADRSIFSFENYGEYLAVVLRGGRKKKTLEELARRLNYKSPRSIAMVIKMDRLPTPPMVEGLSDLLGHSDRERRYFELLVQLEREKRRGRDLGATFKKLEQLNPRRAGTVALTAEQFSYLSDWYHVVIKELVGTPNFRERARWVEKQLKGAVTAEQFHDAVRRMLKLGVLKRNAESRRLSVAKQASEDNGDVPHLATLRHLDDMLHRASEALNESKDSDREFAAATLRISPEKLEEAKREIRRFKEQFRKRYESRSASQIFQLNLQLFPHNKGSD